MSNRILPLIVFLAGASVALAGMAWSLSSFSNVASKITEGTAPPPAIEEAAPAAVANRDGFRALAARAKGQVPFCPPHQSHDQPIVKGPAVIWDLTRDDLCPAHGRLPEEVRADDPDEPLTMFLIVKQDRRFAALYNQRMFEPFARPRTGPVTPVRGFIIDSQLAVIEMPERKPVGLYTLAGDHPGGAVTVKDGVTEVDGDWVRPLAPWIEGVVHGPKWRSEEWIRNGAKGQEGHWKKVAKAIPRLAECRAKGARGPIPELPPKALLWTYWPENIVNGIDVGQRHLPPDQQAGQEDQELTLFLISKSDLIKVDARNPSLVKSRFFVDVLVFPGAKPVGSFTFTGARWDVSKNGSLKESVPPSAAFVTKFMDDPTAFVGR